MLKELARGGMGRVFAAQRDGSAGLCVVKLLSAEFESDPAKAQRMRREAHMLSLMNHPHICRVLDAGFERGAFYIALEYIPGQTLFTLQRDLRKQGRGVPPEVIINVALDVLSGLVYAHDHSGPEGEALDLVHRDLSPNNIMVSYDGETKIIDFGIASGHVDDFKTQPGFIMGTPRYLSPEQARMEPIDRRSDLYSLSVVLYGLFLGRPMIKKAPPGQVLKAVLEKRPRPLPEMVPDFPESVWEVLEKGLRKNKADRWQSADSYRAALREVNPWPLRSRNAVGEFLSNYFPMGKRESAALIAEAEASADLVEQQGPFFDTTGIDVPIRRTSAPIVSNPGDDAETAMTDQRSIDEEEDPTAINEEITYAQAVDIDTGPTVMNNPLVHSEELIAQEIQTFAAPDTTPEPISPSPAPLQNTPTLDQPGARTVSRAAARTFSRFWIGMLILSLLGGVSAGLLLDHFDFFGP